MVDGNWSSLIDFNNVPGGIISGKSGSEIEIIARASTSSNGATNRETSRFALPISDKEMEDIKKSAKPSNTIRRNKWALNVFYKWKENRTPLENEKDLPQIDIIHWTQENLNYWIAKFIMECRKEDGSRYPRNSLVSLIAGLQQSLRENGHTIDFFKNDNFGHLRSCLDAAMKISTQNNIGVHVNQSEVISQSEEEHLWMNGLLGDRNPTQLTHTLFYMNGVNFAIRGGKEHADLSISQFRVEHCEGRKVLIYNEGVTKTYQGGLNQRRLKPVEKMHFENNSNADRCHVRLFEKFLEKRPAGVDRFYLQSKNNVTANDDRWFTIRPLGHNTLKTMMQSIALKAGLPGRKTNHSLKATCATRLYNAGMDEQLIMERTGHRSVLGVRSYKRTSDLLIKNSSMVLNGELLSAIEKRQCANWHNEKSPTTNFNFYNCQVFIHKKDTEDVIAAASRPNAQS